LLERHFEARELAFCKVFSICENDCRHIITDAKKRIVFLIKC